MESAKQTFVIPNSLCKRAGIAATWHSINCLGVFASQHVHRGIPDRPSPYAPCNSSVFNIQKDVLLFEPIIRRLVNESNGIFLNLQQFITDKERKGSDREKELLQISSQYRSIIRACLENLQDKSVRVQPELCEQIKNYITIFYSVEFVWHLCEILFLKNVPGNIVLSHLLEWVQFHFPKYERKAMIYLNWEGENVELDPDYWTTVIGCLLQGRIEVVRTLLKLHSSARSPVFTLFDNTLKTMPVYDVNSGVSTTEFNLRLKHWLIDTQSKIDAKSFVSESHLNLMMKLTIGEETAWNQIKSHCETWYELLVYWLFLTEPTVKIFELGNYAKRCINRMNVRINFKHIDHILLAAFKLDVFEVTKQIQHMSDNGWFVTHLTDLLFHAGSLRILDTSTEENVSNHLRESFLLDYGVLMSSHHSLWQLGLSYLDYCVSDGLQTIKLIIQKLPLGPEVRVRKILREAQKRDLNDVVRSICKIQGLNCLRNDRIGNAFTWALKSQDSFFTSYLADRFLKEYINEGKLSCKDLLENLGSAMLFCDRLTFLSRYLEFHKFYKMKKFKEAGKIIIFLMSSKLTPKYFWVTLFADALPLLESEQLIFSSNDTFTFLHFLEEHYKIKELEDKISIIRLAAARNLARAFIYEAKN